jgi:WD40 repeat protein
VSAGESMTRGSRRGGDPKITYRDLLEFERWVSVALLLCLTLPGCSWDPVAKKKLEFEDQFTEWSLAFSPDGKTLVTDTPNAEEIHVWSLDSPPRMTHTLSNGANQGGCKDGLRFSPDGKLLLSAHGNVVGHPIIGIWNTDSWATAGDVALPDAGAFPLQFGQVAFSPDGRFVMRTEPGSRWDGSSPNATQRFVDSFTVYALPRWDKVWGIKTGPALASNFAISHDGRHAAILGDERRVRQNGEPYIQSRLLIVDLKERSMPVSFDIPGDYMNQVAWSADDRRVAALGNVLGIFDVDGGKELAQFRVDDRPVAIFYTPDGRHLVVAWGKAGVEIWDPEHKHLQQRIRIEPSAAALSPNGRLMAVAGNDFGRGNAFAVSVWEFK